MVETKSPLYEVVLQDLAGKIRNNLLSAGERIPNEDELCRQYKVSRITVKRAMKELSSQGLVVRRRKIGTFVAGRHTGSRVRPVSRRLRTLVFIASFLNDELISDVVHGLSLASMDHGAHLVVQSSLNDPEKERRLIESLPEMAVDGAVIIPIAGKANVEQFFALKLRHEVPFVLADRYFDGLEAPRAITDDVDVGYRLTSFLYDQGHRRIAFVGEDFSVSPARQRYEGYARALHEHQINIDSSLVSVVIPYTVPEGQNRDLAMELEGYRRLLTQRDRPTAVVAVNNYYAYNLIEVARELSLRVPEDVSVVGVGGFQTAGRCRPTLTFMRQDFEGIGREAFHLLRQLLENDGPPEHKAIPAVLEEGQSVRRMS